MTIPTRIIPEPGTFGALIYQHMTTCGLSNPSLGRAVSVDPSTISRWVSGERNPLPKHVHALSDAFGLAGVNRMLFCDAGNASFFDGELDRRTARRVYAVLRQERYRRMRQQEWAEVAT